MSVCGWEISDPGMPITLSAMITPTSTDTRTMWVLLSASQKPTWSYWLLECRLDSYRLLVRRLTPQSAIFLLQLIDLQLIFKIILFQTKSAAHWPGIEGRAATRVFSGIASAWTSSVPHLHLVRPCGGPQHPDRTCHSPDRQHVETTRHSCLIRFARAGKRGPLVPCTLSSAPATTAGGCGRR